MIDADGATKVSDVETLENQIGDHFHDREVFTNLNSEVLMASATPSFFVNAKSIDFASIATMEDEVMKSVFEKIEVSGLKGFFNLSAQALFAPTLANAFDLSTVTADGKISLNIDGNISIVDEDSFASLFNLPKEGISSFADVSTADMEEYRF